MYELTVNVRRLRDGPLPTLSGPGDVVHWFTDLESCDRETLCIACLDARSQLIGRHTAFLGTTDSVFMNPREILRTALLSMATRIIVVHNHPSGIPTPSPEDIATTQQLDKACQIVGIELLDHVIIGHHGRYWSWANDERPQPTSAEATRSDTPHRRAGERR